jgi:hypothetical protein
LTIFNILDIVLNFSGEKYSLALKLVQIDTDPDPDPPNDADLTRSGSTALSTRA